MKSKPAFSEDTDYTNKNIDIPGNFRTKNAGKTHKKIGFDEPGLGEKQENTQEDILLQLWQDLQAIKVTLQMAALPDGPLTREDAAAYLKVCPRTMYELVKQGSVKCYYIGPKRNQMRFRKKDLDDYMETCSVRSYKELAM